VVKDNAKKVRTLLGGKVITGFAGAAVDAITLFERLESKLEQYPQVLRPPLPHHLTPDLAFNPTTSKLAANLFMSIARILMIRRILISRSSAPPP
jgi:ATP-dependent protease HslVU (ClpYQ) peptidase subunit